MITVRAAPELRPGVAGEAAGPGRGAQLAWVASYSKNNDKPMPVNILNLSGYRVLAVREAEHEYHVKAETAAPSGLCPSCPGAETVGHGRVEILIHHLPVHGKQVGVYVDARRLRCQSCGKTFMEMLPGVNDARRLTEHLVKWVGERVLKHTFTSIAEEIGVAE